jgi:hypothetical protein
VARVIALVEGVTEETFVNVVLSTHLYAQGCHSVDARRIGLGKRRGGIVDWPTAKRDILRHLKQDRERLVTTMVDFYALPKGDSNGWPGRAEAGELPFARKARSVQAAVHAEIVAEMGRNFDPSRFLPFVVMYEFEGLLFSDCALFADGIGEPGLAAEFQAIRDSFASPEEINDSPQTAPAKRIEALVPGYTKPLFGTLAALEIGIPAILMECPHFREWVEQLKAWCRNVDEVL